MKRLVFIVILLALGLSSYAKNEAKVDSVCDLSARISNNLLNTIIPDLQKLDILLTAELDSLQKIEKMYTVDLNNLKGNEDYKKLFIQKQFTVEDYIASFKSLDSINVYREEIVLKLEPYKEQLLANAYLSIIDILNSLDEIYDLAGNNDLIHRANKIGEYLLPMHAEQYKNVAFQLKNYRPAVYALGRLFNAIESNKDGVSRTYLEWADEEEVDIRLVQIPFIQQMLERFINGKLTDEEKVALYKACPKAFPQFAK